MIDSNIKKSKLDLGCNLDPADIPSDQQKNARECLTLNPPPSQVQG